LEIDEQVNKKDTKKQATKKELEAVETLSIFSGTDL